MTICLNSADSPYPDATYTNVVANGSWSLTGDGGWAGWGVELTDADGDGLYCATVDDLAAGDYEYVHAGTGESDGWSGWGVLSETTDTCAIEGTTNFGFTIVGGEATESCNGWDTCGCD